MSLKTTRFDAAVHLKTDEAVAIFVDEAFKTADAAIIADALGIAAPARGIAKLAREAGLLGKGSRGAIRSSGLTLKTVIQVLQALGLRLSTRPITEAKPKRRPKAKAGKKAA